MDNTRPTIIGRLKCLFGNHERLRNRVRRKGLNYYTVCRHCGAPMHKRSGGQWARHKGKLPQD